MLLFVLWQADYTYNKLYGYSIFFQHKLPICNILKQSNYKLFFVFCFCFLAFFFCLRWTVTKKSLSRSAVQRLFRDCHARKAGGVWGMGWGGETLLTSLNFAFNSQLLDAFESSYGGSKEEYCGSWSSINHQMAFPLEKRKKSSDVAPSIQTPASLSRASKTRQHILTWMRTNKRTHTHTRHPYTHNQSITARSHTHARTHKNTRPCCIYGLV